MKQLKPIREKAKYYEGIEKAIISFFDTFIFSKLQAVLDGSVGQYYNDMDLLKDALLKGKIQYVDGKFTGKFGAKISKQLKDLGAKWDSSTSSWNLSIDKIPQSIQQIIGMSQTLFKQLYDNILAELASIDIPQALEVFSIETYWIECLDDLDDVTYQTLKDDISIVPEFTEAMKKGIAEDYTNNMKKYIQGFSEAQVKKLRAQVEANTFDGGYRAENLINMIQKEYGVSESKARFLARQETSLLVSSFREQKYKSVGITKYRWSNSHDSRVRPLHKELNGQVFSWDNPPIIDDRTGERGHPGTTYNCRCVAIPVID